MRTEKRVEATREVSATDSITSSYGVGPTDENGLPLFGLKALRRTNTIKTITNEVEESQTPKPTEEPEVCDAKGRPLFGLKALQTTGDYDTMPEQKTSQQLKELVEKHEKNTRPPESQPRQKPRAKLRDSFILQQDEGPVTNVLEEFNSEQRGLSLRSIIQKHENLSQSGGSTHHEIDSSTTVVSTKSVMDSDGSVSLTRDVLQGEMSCKNGDEPVGKIVQTKYSYHSPKSEDNQKGTSKTSKVTTTTVIGNQSLSGPKISEAEDDDIHTKTVTTVRKTSGPTVTEYDDDDEEESEIKQDKSSIISSYKKRLSTDENKVITKSFHRHEETDEDDEPVQRRSSGNFVSLAVRKFSGPRTTDTDNDDEDIQQNVSTSKFSKSSHKQQVVESTEASVAKSSSVRRQIFKDEHITSTSTEEKKKTLIRGDSVRALQHKFQQASENAANMTQRSYPKAGLILRTSSFSSSEERDNSLKQSSNVKQSRHDSPEKVSQTKSEQIIETVSTSKVVGGSTGVDKSERSTVSTTTTAKKASSFLDNTSRVTGVQDVLTRMKNADLVVESGDTNEDTEARALLNKFLGASVILQGMEQGMKSDSAATPGSAALVSRVERQRIATSNRKQEEDIDNIWDEKQLRILLEACSDYESRRKIRQRLRTVMAEHKACADVVADAGEDISNSSVSQECFESKHMSTKTGSSTLIQSEAHSRTTSSTSRLTKANSVTSPFAKFKQLERQNSAPRTFK